MWLVVHSDGWPPSTHIGIDGLMAEAIQVAKDELAKSEHQFDEAWWLDNAAISLNSKLYQIT